MEALNTGAVLAENFWGLAPERCRLLSARKYNCATMAVCRKNFGGVHWSEAWRRRYRDTECV